MTVKMKRRPGAGHVFAAVFGIVLLVMGGCAPDSGFNSISDFDVVVTHYDPEADFQTYTTFAVADTVAHLGNPSGNDDGISKAIDPIIIDEITTQMIRMGYTLENNPENNLPDLFMLPGITVSTWTGYVPGYPWYPGYGWGGWYPYYPWYPGYMPGYTYSYDTGTIIVDMVDVSTLDEETGDVLVIWTGGINGVVSGSSSSNYDRVEGGIRQAFDQSPYLKKKDQ